MTTYISFEVDVHTWVTREAYPDDEWSRDSTDGSVTIEDAKIVESDGYNVLAVDADLSSGDEIYLVWAQYGTGDSFGSDGGRYELLEVYTDAAEAHKRVTYYENVTDYSVPWNGYFEWLQGVHVDKFTL